MGSSLVRDVPGNKRYRDYPCRFVALKVFSFVDTPFICAHIVTAGRIWWLGRKIQNRGGGETYNERYKRAVSMMYVWFLGAIITTRLTFSAFRVESGSLYSVCFIIFLVLYGLNMPSASVGSLFPLRNHFAKLVRIVHNI